MVKKSAKGDKPAAYNGEESFWRILPANERKKGTAAAKKKTTKKHEIVMNRQFMHTKHTRI